MGIRSLFNLRKLILVIVAAALMTGCVTESNNRMEQNRDPKKAIKAYVDAGMTYLQRNQMDNAHRTLTRAYEIDPDDASVNNGLAMFFSVEGDKPQAEKHFKKAIASDAEFSQARNNYAAFLFGEGRYDDATEQLELVVKDYRYTRRYTAFENLGLCYLKKGDTEKAEQSFAKALRLNASMAVSLLEMAELSFNKGDNLEAQNYLTNFEKVSKATPRQLWLGIRLQRKLGDKNKVASYELALRNMFPGSPEYQAYKEAK